MRKYILYRLPDFICLFIFKLLNIGTLLGYSFLIRNLVNLAFEENPLEHLANYIPICVVYALLLVFLYIISSVLYTNYFNKCMYLMKEDYVHTLLNSSYEKIVRKDSAYYISALCNDTMLIRNNFVTAIFIMIDEGITLLGAFICMFILNKTIAAIMIGVIVIVSVVPYFFKEIMNRANNKVSEMLEKYTTGVKDVLGGVDVIKTFQMEKRMEDRLQSLNNEVRLANIHRDYKGTALSAITSCMSNIIELGLIILTIYYVTQGKMDIGSVSAILTLMGYFFGPIETLTNQVGCIMGSRDIRKKFLFVISQYREAHGIKPDNIDIDEPKKFICVDHLSYSYDQNRTILREVSFNIEKGKKYLILGESGGGKSTLLKLISKMYTEYEGDIYIGNRNYKDLLDKEVNQIITYSHQKTYLFQGTIRSNIDIENTNDTQKLEKCIETCQLKQLINKLSDGIDTRVSEEINRLSEGEKLRIGLARALYRDNPVLLLDEITASLDTTNSMEIEKMILAIKNKTVLNICHKFSASIASQYDKLIIIENGRISLMGNFDEVSNSPLFEKYKFNSL